MMQNIDPRIRMDAGNPAWVELSTPCDMALLEPVQAVFEALDSDLPERTREDIAGALHELLANAMEWGGKLNASATVVVRRIRASRMVMYCISDPGEGFREEDALHAAVGYPEQGGTNHLDIRNGRGLRPGGYGLVMVRKLVDDLIFNQAHNQVLFVKYF